MSGLCRDCKWWDREDVADFIEPPHWGACNLAGGMEEDLPAGVPFSAEGGWLKTAPDFGCNQWASKAEKKD